MLPSTLVTVRCSYGPAATGTPLRYVRHDGDVVIVETPTGSRYRYHAVDVRAAQ